MAIKVDRAVEDSIVRIGTVISVKGRSVEVEVDKTKNTSHLVYRGELLKNISVGGYVKIVKGFTRIIGKVEGELVTEDKREGPATSYRSNRSKIRRVLTLSLLGFFKGREFERGIKELPLLDNECFLLQRREFEQVHNFIRDSDAPITIGELAFEPGQEIRVGVNGLFASHIGIFGNTGSGKSYTLAKLYCELFRVYASRRKFRKNARFFLIDFNGEYVGEGEAQAHVIVDSKYKQRYRLSTRAASGVDKIELDRDALRDADFWVVFLEATERTQTPFLRRALANRRVEEGLTSEAGIKELIEGILLEALSQTDKNVERTAAVNFLKEFNNCIGDNTSLDLLIEDYQSHLKWHGMQNKFYYQSDGRQTYSDAASFQQDVVEAKVAPLAIGADDITAIDRIRLQIVVQYYLDVIRGFSNREYLAPLIKRLDKRIDDLKKVIELVEGKVVWWKKNLIVLSLKDVNIQMRKVLPLLLCKKIYADHKAAAGGGTYLNIIIDEAHNILSEKSERESEQWKDYRLETFEEIIKEGRKFGVFLTVASQRPADISPTIISQLHNYFLHRLINNEDINAVRQTISYLDRVSFETLPMLPTGTCVFAGLVASLPVVLDVGEITPARHEPRNKTMTLTDKW